ncbi:uncharacterized protein LOC6598815 [Drosophila persimilis]|uniref:uncharacterized protein LOC6598815 n=1 Tax=Drosophila persimilis TaxID=7234 RepID=UPI000F07B42A|nr:uncharacterized protein LOC6598815 [Drosophila persimilis]
MERFSYATEHTITHGASSSRPWRGVIRRIEQVPISLLPNKQEGQGQVLAEYVRSRRGTGLVYYEGNTYTPNEKLREGQKSRDWKCSMYHKAKCRARLVTRHTRIGDLIHVTSRLHTHPRMYDHLHKSEDKDSRKLFPKLSPHKKESK